MHKICISVVLSCLLLFTAACSKNPTQGQEMISQGSKEEKMGKKWIKGEKLVKKGSSEIQDGREKISTGNRLMKESEKKYNLMEENNNKNED